MTRARRPVSVAVSTSSSRTRPGAQLPVPLAFRRHPIDELGSRPGQKFTNRRRKRQQRTHRRAIA
jgi:hypothetical protein